MSGEGRAVWICNRCQFAVPTDEVGRELMRAHLLEHLDDDRLLGSVGAEVREVEDGGDG